MKTFIEILKGLGTIVLYFLISLITSYLLKDYYFSSNYLIASIAQLIPYIVLLITLFLIYHKQLINDFKNFQKSYFQTALKKWIIGFGVMIISNLIISMFIKSIPTNETLNREILTSYPLSNIITMIFIGPLVEEITFRASFKKAFNNKYLFCFITAFLFGFAHIVVSTSLLEILYIIPYGALGYFLADAYYETNNIYTSYFMHLIHNSFCIIMIFALSL